MFQPNLDSVYNRSSVNLQRERYIALRAVLLGTSPDMEYVATVRAPGRVNLLSEHTDYNGYPVCPIAIEKDVVIAIARSNTLRTSSTEFLDFTVTNDNPAFPGGAIRVGLLLSDNTLSLVPPKIETSKRFEWIDYVKAGFTSSCNILNSLLSSEDANTVAALKNISVTITGNQYFLRANSTLPIASGLSSSSALTVASMYSLLSLFTVPQSHGNVESYGSFDHIRRVLCSKIEVFPKYAVAAEKLVGLQGGGMDQTISICAERGKVSVIHFDDPSGDIRLKQYSLPRCMRIVCCSSLKDSKKIAASNYNIRVAECRIGAALILAKELMTASKTYREYLQTSRFGVPPMLHDAQKYCNVKVPIGMIARVDDLGLQEHIYPSDEGVLAKLGFADYDELKGGMLMAANGSCLLPSDVVPLAIQQRLRHVFSEAHRAILFERSLNMYEDSITEFNSAYDDWLNANKGGSSPQDAILNASDSCCNDAISLSMHLAEFITQSYTSCRDDYECSCTELDEVITHSKTAGAFASRLTGAGFGGYAICLVHDVDVESFLANMRSFYAKKLGAVLTEERFADICFEASPSSCACIVSNIDV